jgi:hypothetical protein
MRYRVILAERDRRKFETPCNASEYDQSIENLSFIQHRCGRITHGKLGRSDIGPLDADRRVVPMDRSIALGRVIVRRLIEKLRGLGQREKPVPKSWWNPQLRSIFGREPCNDPLICCSGAMFPKEIAHEYRDGRIDQARDGASEVGIGSGHHSREDRGKLAVPIV